MDGPAAAEGPAAALDAVDRRRIHIAISLVAATGAGGIGFVLGVTYLEVCAACIDERALTLLGIAPAWAAAMAVAAGQWAWRRTFGSGVAAAFLLAWLALHFLVPGLAFLYAPAWHVAATYGWSIGFLLYWSAAGMAMVGAVLGAARGLDRFV